MSVQGIQRFVSGNSQKLSGRALEHRTLLILFQIIVFFISVHGFFAAGAAAQPASTRMLPNQNDNRCVIVSDVNALVHNQRQGNGGIGLSPYFTPKTAADKLVNCLSHKGLWDDQGVRTDKSNFAAEFCACNAQITDQKDLRCTVTIEEEKSHFSISRCREVAAALRSGGIALMNLCLAPPLYQLGHAVTVVEMTCDEQTGGATVKYIDSNNLEKGIITTTINSERKISSPPSVPVGSFRYELTKTCGFITKVPASALTDPLLATE